MTDVRLECGGQMRRVLLERDTASIDGELVSFREVRRGGMLTAIEVGGELLHEPTPEGQRLRFRIPLPIPEE